MWLIIIEIQYLIKFIRHRILTETTSLQNMPTKAIT